VDKKDQNSSSKKVATTQQELADELLYLIKTPESRQQFLEFLELEFSVENLLFIEACQAYERLAEHNLEAGGSAIQVVQQAKLIQESYLNPNSASAMNISFSQRKAALVKVDQFISSQDCPVDAHLFDEAKKSILFLMVSDSYGRFKSSLNM
jgi:hypothetical protein